MHCHQQQILNPGKKTDSVTMELHSATTVYTKARHHTVALHSIRDRLSIMQRLSSFLGQCVLQSTEQPALSQKIT